MKGGFARKLVATLVSPLVYAGFLVAFELLLCVGTYLYLWDSSYNPLARTALPPLRATLAYLVSETLPLAALVAAAAVLLRIARRPGLKAVTLLFTVGCLGATLYYGPAAVRFIGHPLVPQSAFHPFVPDRLHVLDGAVVYTGSVDGDTLSNVAVIATDRLPASEAGQSPAFEFARRAVLDPRTATMRYDDRRLAVSPANPYFGPLFAPPSYFAGLTGDLGSLSGALHRSESDPRFGLLALCAAVALLTVGGLFFGQLTRWPVMNALLLGLYVRGIFYLFALLDRFPVKQTAERLAREVSLGKYAGFALPAAIGFVGLLLILLDLLFFLWRRADGFERG